MGKRILISEEEKKEIKKLHNLQESWADDAIKYIKDKGESLVGFVKDIFTDDEEEKDEKEGDEKEKSDKEKEKDTEEKIKDLEGKDRKKFEKELEKDGKFDSEIVDKYDRDFYKKILDGVDAPHTDENLKFLYAWRKAESGKAKNNPFNTTQGMKNDSNISNYNSVGVKNYSSKNIGVDATVKTLLNGRYPCIVRGLKNDAGAEKIAACSSDLKTWGTGDLISKVLRTKKFTPPRIED
jgi:hypothetical protein